ncbi:alpha/beta fold hydrolase [Streptomyces sp. GC420]|uniref:alpha/beta fold hydrolase n=1 Tax=Streptomyces sp. GC420 TaxID=2697568 RepID=UPI0014150148|nr:alpha/beta hydrolase [Streptomyces sp. GC420]NBM19227.1 alpha/beta fold hydrolase [Streptomyces sp. GC420]
MSRLTHVTSGPYAPPAPARELSAVSADGSRLHVEVHGPEGAPAVVLVHGWTCSTAFWARQVTELAAGHRVVVYDQRGHGRSPAPAGPAGYSTEALADDLDTVLAATLEPGERAVIAGHSMGGMTLMAAAERAGVREHAAAVLLCSTGSSRLVAESTVVPLRAGRVRTRVTGAILSSRAPLGPVTPLGKKILKYATMAPGSSPEQVEACARIVHACPRMVRYGWSRVLAELELARNVGKLTMPAAVLCGTADRLTPPVLAREIAEALPDCVGLTELAGIGHMTPVEAPDAVTAEIRRLVGAYVAAAPAAASRTAGEGATTVKTTRTARTTNISEATEATEATEAREEDVV